MLLKRAERARILVGSNSGFVSSLAASWVAPWAAVALAVVFLLVNEAGYGSVSAITEIRDDTLVTRIAVGRLRSAVVVTESAQRALLLTERPVYRQAFFSALARLAVLARGR